ncbi:MAG: 1,6-anhydro-N-acetylmuramyl-L-alanine amidase AmpD [Succinivibrio sp.]|nr:1,6-anhydro-N-acetylmuramyl-L-alanine amidase AmpD [Succinivibrio sp.]
MYEIAQGWMRGVRIVKTPRFNSRPAGTKISLVVIHYISLPPLCFGGDCVDRLFTGTLDENAHPYFKGLKGLECSSHLFINRAGLVTQYVSFDDRAWHAGRSSWQGKPECNDYSVGIELEGCEWCPFMPEQYEALRGCLKALKAAYPSINSIAGHSDVAPGRKRDPGPQFDWSQIGRILPRP